MERCLGTVQYEYSVWCETRNSIKYNSPLTHHNRKQVHPTCSDKRIESPHCDEILLVIASTGVQAEFKND